MGIGHAAVALGASRAAPRVNAGILIFAAFLADFLLGIFAALGMEQAHVPLDYATRHYLTFTFPYSHGLSPLILWGVLFGATFCWVDRKNRARAFWVIAALVFSHFILDGLVHVRGLPLFGESSPKVGLALWSHMPLELTLESLMAVAGLVIYWRMQGGTRVSRWGMTAFVVVLTGLTWTQLFSTTAPTNAQLIPGWIISPIVFSLIPYAFDRRRVAAVAT